MRGKFSKTGRATMLCVFHREKTPSLYVWPDGGFLCFGCQTRGWMADHPEIERRYQALRHQSLKEQMWLFDPKVWGVSCERPEPVVRESAEGFIIAD